MPLQERTLPLFPLNTVLFPNASLPIEVIEGRYSLMIEQCLAGDSRFGMVLIRLGARVGEPMVPYSTGTVARIIQVSRVAGGRMFVSVTGQERFHIETIAQYHPYMTARVQLLKDNEDECAPSAASQAVRCAVARYVSLALGLRGGWTRQPRVPSDPRILSYYVAALLQVKAQEKQALLEEPSASGRLERELSLLGRESEALKRRVGRGLRQRFSRQ